jgi:hypothetical protein
VLLTPWSLNRKQRRVAEWTSAAFQKKIMLFADEFILMKGLAKHQLANQKYLPAKLE